MPSKNNINTTTQTTNAPPSTAPAELTNYIGTPPFEFVPEERDPESVLFRLLACPHRFGIDAKPLSIPMYAGDAQRDDRGGRVVPLSDGTECHYNLNFLVRWNKDLNPVGQCEMVLHGFAHVLLGHLGPLACYKSDQKWGEADVNRVRLPDIMKEFEAETVTLHGRTGTRHTR